MSQTQSFYCTRSFFPELVTSLKNWLVGNGFNCEQLIAEDGEIVLKVEKRGWWRKVIGMSTAFTILLHAVENTVNVEIRAERWYDKVAAGVLSLFILWPLVITAGIGIYQQINMRKRVFEKIGIFLEIPEKYTPPFSLQKKFSYSIDIQTLEAFVTGGFLLIVAGILSLSVIFNFPDLKVYFIPLLATVGGWIIYKHYKGRKEYFSEKQEKENSILNPYIVGAPLKDSIMFFGRDDIFEKIRTHLIGKHQDNSIVIYGQRRTGKTSILYQLEQRLNRHGECYVAVLIDLQGLTLKGTENFLWELACTIRNSLYGKYPIELFERNVFQSEARNNFREYFLPSIQHAIGNRHLLLLFDETDRLEEAITDSRIDKDFPDYLRNLMQHQKNLSFVFVRGSKFAQMTQQYALMFNVTLSIEVGFLELTAARSLITQPIKGLYAFEDAAVDYLLDITSCHPFFTQLLCQQIFILWEKRRWKRVTKTDIESVLEVAADRAVVNFEYIWNESDSYQKLVLSALAEISREKCTIDTLEQHLREKNISLQVSTINDALVELSKREIVKSAACPVFTVELFRFWLIHERPLNWVYSQIQNEFA